LVGVKVIIILALSSFIVVGRELNEQDILPSLISIPLPKSLYTLNNTTDKRLTNSIRKDPVIPASMGLFMPSIDII